MIACVEGHVLELTENACILLTSGGVGYEIFVPGNVLSRPLTSNDVIRLYTATIVREDALELYGFESWDERETFHILISISKVGPRTALAMLSRYSPADLRDVVLNEDVTALTLVPGIGKKTAQHVFLELKYKLKVGDAPVSGGQANVHGSLFTDALQGLTNLGYSEDEARPVLTKVLTEEPDLDVSGALRASLRALARGA